jgi:hypothetical protein
MVTNVNKTISYIEDKNWPTNIDIQKSVSSDFNKQNCQRLTTIDFTFHNNIYMYM